MVVPINLRNKELKYVDTPNHGKSEKSKLFEMVRALETQLQRVDLDKTPFEDRVLRCFVDQEMANPVTPN